MLGPMVLAIAVIDVDREGELKELGVKDSKQLAPQERKRIYEELTKLLPYYRIIRVEPFEIDSFVAKRGLNVLEAMKAAELIESALQNFPPHTVYVDCPDVDVKRYENLILQFLGKKVHIVARHGADAAIPIVSAASILAKVVRDDVIRRIGQLYGEFGSGYPHDQLTVRFVEKWVKNYHSLPPFARKSWNPSERILNKHTQTKITEW